MGNSSLRWKAMAGFLVMISFISGTSALECHQCISLEQRDSQGNILSEESSSVENVTCSPENQACIDAQLELSIVSHTLFVRYRGCNTTTDPNGGSESTTSGDKYFATRFNVSYCSSNLCNVATADADEPSMPRTTELSKPSNSSQCYSGFNFGESEIVPKRVTCYRDSDQCFQGIGNITAGGLSMKLYISSCRSTCVLPPRQIFGPIEVNIPESSCCLGSYCNKKEDADHVRKNHTWETHDGSYGVPHTTISTNVAPGYELEFDDYSDGSDLPVGTSLPTVYPRGKRPVHGKGAILQLSPLLVTLGISVLGLWL